MFQQNLGCSCSIFCGLIYSTLRTANTTKKAILNLVSQFPASFSNASSLMNPLKPLVDFATCLWHCPTIGALHLWKPHLAETLLLEHLFISIFFSIPNIHLDLLSIPAVHLEILWVESIHSMFVASTSPRSETLPGLQGQHKVLLLDVRATGQREQGPQRAQKMGWPGDTWRYMEIHLKQLGFSWKKTLEPKS